MNALTNVFHKRGRREGDGNTLGIRLPKQVTVLGNLTDSFSTGARPQMFQRENHKEIMSRFAHAQEILDTKLSTSLG